MNDDDKRRWNPLDMTDRQASNLALLVGLVGLGWYIFTGFPPDKALLAALSSGCIAQRFLIGGRPKRGNDDREDASSRKVATRPSDESAPPMGDRDPVGPDDRHSARHRLAFRPGL